MLRFLLLLLSAWLPLLAAAQNNSPGSNQDQLNTEDNKELMPCFDYYPMKENAVWAKDKELSRTYARKCDWSLSYLVLNPDSTFACIIRTEKANWLQAGRWQLHGPGKVSLEHDNALSEEFLCAFNNQKGNLYTIAHIVSSGYALKENHLIPVTTLSLPAEVTPILPIPEVDTDLHPGPGKAEDKQRKVIIKGKLFRDASTTIPLSHVFVYLQNSKGEVKQAVKTDTSGFFTFSHKMDKETYSLSLSDSTVSDNTRKEIYLADEKGRIVQKMLASKGSFRYVLLPQMQSSITETVFEIH